MSIVIAPEPVPLRETEPGVLRIGKSRVLLEVLYGQYQQGINAEELHEQFPTTELADVHAVIAFCLRHPEFIDEYMSAYEREADRIEKLLWNQGLQEKVARIAEDDAPAAGPVR